MKILTLGKLSQNKDEAKAMIEKLGGKLTGSANKASLCISTKSEFNGLMSLASVRRVCVWHSWGSACHCLNVNWYCTVQSLCVLTVAQHSQPRAIVSVTVWCPWDVPCSLSEQKV